MQAILSMINGEQYALTLEESDIDALVDAWQGALRWTPPHALTVADAVDSSQQVIPWLHLAAGAVVSIGVVS